MIKLLDLLKENNPFVSRGGKERVETYSLKRKTETENRIQQYIKNGMKGNLYLSTNPITSLPSSLTRVEGDLDLSFTKITSLPDNLTVGGYLNLDYTPIISLPSDLTVGGYLNLNRTPLSKKYSEEEIRAMVPNVKGKIFI
ncbi:hypothetical protein UFOVP331_194 [uncultured Caudovirales phage]|uniref:Uncharacterized protein n=1 Tax=uncultured Caudovirales phage TaxID=2100421 RepID=A0A6J5LVL0_9CAUD|nr:hypothetical protein UFOVP331_194 [uncultured Caudovirales phage]